VCERLRQICSVGGKGWTLLSLRYDTLCDVYLVCWEGVMAEGCVYSEHPTGWQWRWRWKRENRTMTNRT